MGERGALELPGGVKLLPPLQQPLCRQAPCAQEDVCWVPRSSTTIRELPQGLGEGNTSLGRSAASPLCLSAGLEAAGGVLACPLPVSSCFCSPGKRKAGASGSIPRGSLS